MKNKRQAQSWQEKIPYFADGTIEAIWITLVDVNKQITHESTLAICKDGLALHQDKDNSTLFVITHIPSGLRVMRTRKDKVNGIDFAHWGELAEATWASKPPEIQSKYKKA